MIRKYMIGIATLLIAVLLVACGDKEESSEPDVEPNEPPVLEIKDEEKIPDKDVVAIVNGEDLTGKSYNLVYAQLKLQESQMSDKVDEEKVKEATMRSLIDRTILMQDANNEGIEVTEDEAKKELETIKSENEEGLNSILEQFQMTEDGFLEQLQFELTSHEYVEKLIDVEVTDEEVEEIYNEVKEENGEIPELDEIKDQLKGNIVQDKTNEALQNKIDKIKEKAKIENKLEA